MLSHATPKLNSTDSQFPSHTWDASQGKLQPPPSVHPRPGPAGKECTWRILSAIRLRFRGDEKPPFVVGSFEILDELLGKLYCRFEIFNVV